MKYAPTNKELDLLSQMSEEERLTYCLTRIAESEEVWGLAESQGWVINDNSQQSALPIWPYKAMANLCINEDRINAEAQAISLEHFVYNVSQQLIENSIAVEVFPTIESPGHIMEAKAFFKVLENIMESGEYFMEG